MTTNSPQLVPVFDFATGETSILLHESATEVCLDGTPYKGEGEVRLELLRRANIYVYGFFNGVPVHDALSITTGQKSITSFSIGGQKVEGFFLNIGGDATIQEINIKWCPKSEPVIAVGNNSTAMTHVTFHLFNFVPFFGERRSSEQHDGGVSGIHHIDLVSDDLEVELKSLPSTPGAFETLKAEGGYQLTHIGGIIKKDGSTFSTEDADDCLYALQYFLSFAKGGWGEPVCAVGFDASGNRVWESWSSPKEPWHTPMSWFDPRTSEQLITLFPLFMKCWANENWRETLHEVIYWYLSANQSSRGIDTGIILMQAAIERLAYEFVVRDKLLLTEKGFKDLRASDKFRLFFSSEKIPLDIPAETPELIKLSRQFNWLDAPHALTEIRNSLIHPDHKRRGQLDNVYYEAWKLGLWYLELGILAVCGYSGTYRSRLKCNFPGQGENVPWA